MMLAASPVSGAMIGAQFRDHTANISGTSAVLMPGISPNLMTSMRLEGQFSLAGLAGHLTTFEGDVSPSFTAAQQRRL